MQSVDVRRSAGFALVAAILAACSSAAPSSSPTTAGPPAARDIIACHAVVSMYNAAASGTPITATQLSSVFATGQGAADPGLTRHASQLDEAVHLSNGPNTTRAINALIGDCRRLRLTT
jgi:hypothetical protein